MIHSAFNKSDIARRYYALASGENLTNQEAINRWRMLRNPDRKILQKVIRDVCKDALKQISAA